MSNFYTGAKNLFVKLLSLLLLACVLLLASGFLLNYCTRDTSPIVPLSQSGQKIKSPGLISPEGSLLLPVASVCEKNFYKVKTTQVKSSTNLLVGYSMMILPTNNNESGVSICYYLDGVGNILDLTICQGGKQISVEAGYKLRKSELYLPAGLFSTLFGLQVDLTEDGKGLIRQQKESTPPPPAASTPDAVEIPPESTSEPQA